MRVHTRILAGLFLLAAILAFHTPIDGRESPVLKPDKGGGGAIDRVFVLDGTGIHNAGNLQVHTGNWGIFGSYPGSSFPTSEFPSAQWPANSGVEYLYIGGLWVGARVNGMPAVSTSAYEMEFRPTADPIDRIYSSFENAPGGSRLPSPGADDDMDGMIDEDWLDGHDNDLDGMIDEDYAAISRQMFSSWCTDDQPEATANYPEHTPLHVMLRQESYQWEDEEFYDFVGFKYTITNIGNVPLEDLYLGLLIDGDAGPRSWSNFWADDASGRWTGTLCSEIGPAFVDLAYIYDVDGDGGLTTGYLGAMILGHTTDPLGIKAPAKAGMTSFHIFSGDQPFENGGDPTNDFERYELMSKNSYDPDVSIPSDYRMLLSTGGFGILLPGESLVLYVALVAGEGLDGMLDNAAKAQALFNGQWIDLDRDPVTGSDRRETPVRGPATGVVIDPCRAGLSEPVNVPYGQILWINADCEQEEGFKSFCAYSEADSLIFRTGVAGRETQIHWLLSMPQPTLNLLDIRPCSCPNPFNVKLFGESKGRGKRKGGMLPVAILGSEEFDVHLIDPASLKLEGVSPVYRKKCSFEDVSRPVIGWMPCECTTEGADGYLDMILHFRDLEIADAIAVDGIPNAGEEKVLTLTGMLFDGTPFEASDCVKFVGRRLKPGGLIDEIILRPALPNPFNPVTRISFYLPEKQNIRLEIFDVSGRLVMTLADGPYPRGESAIEWKASGLSSGIYFYRLKAGDYVETKKVVLMR
ncbi:MAG: T9SS type A sorting domain-containing protein [Candidatus Krumholzibacteriota bacterium]|nr:T9SS type A sorting domain-containing protein [Candidatus Krumholzibacteriota bacterium]